MSSKEKDGNFDKIMNEVKLRGRLPTLYSYYYYA
jgi:hypothetical protein